MIRVLVADDHTIVREGLKQILATSGELVVAGEAANGNDVLKPVRDAEWNVPVTDMSMPSGSGIGLITAVKHARPTLSVLVLSMYGEDQYPIRAIRAGAAMYR
jgi:two-component system invasion response regulator UvrY